MAGYDHSHGGHGHGSHAHGSHAHGGHAHGGLGGHAHAPKDFGTAFAIGIVLEALQSQQDLIQARLDYAGTVGELNKAQVRLKTAAGE